MSERKGKSSYLVVYAALIALTIGAAAVSTYAYFKYIQYDRVALFHVPSNAALAFYLNVEKVTLFDPVRRYGLPLVDELGASGQAAGRLARIKSRTGLDPAVQLREIAFSRGPTADDWTLVLAGKFPKRGVVAGIASVLRQEKNPPHLSRNGAILTGAGWTLGQARDGALVIASRPTVLSAALPASVAWRGLGLSNSQAGSFYVSGAWARGEGRRLATEAPAALKRLDEVDRVTGTLKLDGGDADVEIAISLHPGVKARVVRPGFQELLEALLRLSQRLGKNDVAGERKALAGAELAVAGPSLLHTRFQWSHADMERGAASLARAVRARFGPQ